MLWIDIIVWVVLLIPALMVSLYYGLFVTLRQLGRSYRVSDRAVASHRFVIVIPAHNEQTTLPRTLHSCQTVDYPQNLLRVLVVADNCADNTVRIATDMGFDVLQRHDPQHAGKGFALQAAFDQLLYRTEFVWDVVLVLDADCPLELDTLRKLDSALADGHDVLQANHRVTNADASPIAYAASVGRVLEYDLFFAPKTTWRLAVLLVGTGMVLRRTVLERIPWNAQGIVEDTEYTIELAQHRIPVRFVANSYIQWTSAETVEELRVQRTRWADGNLRLSRIQALRLLGSGLRQGNLLLADLGVTLLLLSRPLVLLHAGLAVVAAMFCSVNQIATWPSMLLAAIVIMALQARYLWCGIAMLGLNRKRMTHLLAAPLVVLRLTVVAIKGLIAKPESKWNRTPRRER
ncbi:MAG: glycosyltransferase family 2 protein [Planctomycetales bacterium]|nr:glycosyltransferase family 2 protein [Planctomycetales bacterium]